MAETFQQVVDSQLDRQEERRKRALAIALLLIAIFDESEPALRLILERYLTPLTRPGVRVASPEVQAQLDAFRREITVLRAGQMEQVHARYISEITPDVQAEWDFLIQKYGPLATGELKSPLPSRIQDLADAAFLGRGTVDWMTDLVVNDSNRIADTATVGLVRDLPKGEIIRAILGSENLDGNDGATSVTRSQLKNLVDTAVFAAIAQARDLFSIENEALIPRELYVAVLDDRTTQICRSLNGHVYPVGVGPIPPLHWHCRSIRVPFPLGEDMPTLP